MYESQLYASDDYWAIWSGLTYLILALIITGLYDGNVPNPTPSTSSPASFTSYLLLVVVSTVVAATARRAIIRAKAEAKGKDPNGVGATFAPMVQGFLILSVIACLSQLIGNVDTLKNIGLSNEFWALLFGLILVNGADLVGYQLPKCLTKEFACSSSMYINIGLVLLALDIQTLLRLGFPGFFVSWIGTPIVFVGSMWFANKALGFDKFDDMAVMLSAGLSICGNSAASAIQSSIQADETELSIVLALLTLMSTFQIFVVPFIAIGLGVSKRIAAGWIGAAVDSTGSVLASAAILDGGQDIINIASTVKMIQNILISFVAVGVSIVWSRYKNSETQGTSIFADEHTPLLSTGATTTLSVQTDDSLYVSVGTSDTEVPNGPLVDLTAGKSDVDGAARPKASCIDVWHKFPKFVLGFLIVSITLSVLSASPNHHHQESQVRIITSAASSFWFTVGFVCVGIEAHIATIRKKLSGGAFKLIALYSVGQTFDLLLRFGLAWVAFGMIVPN